MSKRAPSRLNPSTADRPSIQWPRPAEGVRLYMLDDEAVLYSHRAQALYSFNSAATLIWCGLELNEERAATTAMLASALGCSPAQASAHVEAILAQWETLGILAGSAPPVPEARNPIRQSALAEAIPELRPDDGNRPMLDRRYRLLATGVRVQFQFAAHESVVHPVLAHLEAPGTECTTTVSITGDGARHFIYIDGRPAATCVGLDRLAPVVKGAVWLVAIRPHSYFLHIHAGVIGDDEGLIVLPAPSGRGKSTLTAGLVHAGFEYFSDEVALLEEKTFRVAPVPMSLCVKSAAWDLLAPLYPDLQALPIHLRPDGKHVRYLAPPRHSLPTNLSQSLPVRRIIFPRFEPRSPSALNPLSKAAALARLLEQCLAVRLELDDDRVASLVSWMKGLEAYELTMSSLADGVALVGRVSSRRRAGKPAKCVG